ncbi:YIP1 family protein [Methanofollis aquaemaris]|uniref:YIP1 family protein n=1 Tax=Methanofollis aquaemaris TaxID=126734 RepID=A0A8A3S7P1_9EURY|nr:Yip1 family protein [Methanofollis aquaemaris]QSZ67700.1 YIP1 family protein [Methanofollis aquaemaris]
MSYSFIQKITGILFRPAQTFRDLEDESLWTALVHYLKLSVLFSALMTLTLYTLPGVPTTRKWAMASQVFQPLDFFAFLAVILIVGPLLVGIWLHVWAFLLGGRGGIGQTLKTALYSYTPFLVLVWIPILGLFAGAVSTLYPQVVGIRELHHLPPRRAKSAVCVAVFLSVVALVAIIVMILVAPPPMLSSLSTGTGAPVVPDCPYLLNQSDLPEEITLMYAHEVDEEMIMRNARDLGCLKEYTELYAEEKTSSTKSWRISHFVMVFPPGNAMEMVQHDDEVHERMVSLEKAEKLQAPALGDLCISYKLLDMRIGDAEAYDGYMISFAKGNVYERFITTGPFPDYELLKDLAQRAAAKIP